MGPRHKLVIYSGYVVLASICAMLLSIAYLGGGHPSGTGIVNGLLLIVVGPLSAVASVVGLRTRQGLLDRDARTYHVMSGVCLAFALFFVVLAFLKLVLGRAM